MLNIISRGRCLRRHENECKKKGGENADKNMKEVKRR